MLAVLLKLIVAFVIFFLLVWVGWFLFHKDALYYLACAKDKKWKRTEDSSAHFLQAGAKKGIFFQQIPHSVLIYECIIFNMFFFLSYVCRYQTKESYFCSTWAVCVERCLQRELAATQVYPTSCESHHQGNFIHR